MSSCLIIAGEMSGEDHALTFFKKLRQKCPHTSFFGVGGNRLRDQGVELLYHLNDFSSFGYSEVFTRVPFYFKALANIAKEVKKRNCKTAILIDFQTFNLKLAQKLKKQGVKVLYFVAPQAWAWKSYRAKTLSKCVHTLFAILPFEKKWFMDRGVSQVISIKHPLTYEYEKDLIIPPKTYPQNRSKKILLLPGSRNFEVRLLLPEMIESIVDLSKKIDIEIGILKSPSVEKKNFVEPLRYLNKKIKGVQYVEFENLRPALDWADLVFAASGTVTLSCGLHKVPTIVCYKTSHLNYFIFENLINYQGPGSLSNIIEGDNITKRDGLMFPELMQDDFSHYNLTKEALRILTEQSVYETIVKRCATLKEKLTGQNINMEEYVASIIS